MSYVANLDEYKEDVQFEFLKIYKKFLQESFTRVASDTPVDTGVAQSSWWIVQENQTIPSLAKLGSGVPKPPSLYWMTWKNSKAELVNPAPYMIYLNDGWSKQAPTNFIELAIKTVANLYK